VFISQKPTLELIRTYILYLSAFNGKKSVDGSQKSVLQGMLACLLWHTRKHIFCITLHSSFSCGH